MNLRKPTPYTIDQLKNLCLDTTQLVKEEFTYKGIKYVICAAPGIPGSYNHINNNNKLHCPNQIWRAWVEHNPTIRAFGCSAFSAIEKVKRIIEESSL